MSKVQLKKLLRTMSADDLAALVVQVYDARKEAKDYLEFYLNPDINAKMQKALEEIEKELNRVYRHFYTPRFVRIKSAIKHFMSYGPDDESACRMLTEVMKLICLEANRHHLRESYSTGAVAILTATLKRLNDAALVSNFLPEIETAIESLNTKHIDCRQLKIELEYCIQEFPWREALRPD